MLEHPQAAELSDLGFNPTKQALALRFRRFSTALLLVGAFLSLLSALSLGFVSRYIYQAILSGTGHHWLGALLYTYLILVLVRWPLPVVGWICGRRWQRLAAASKKNPSLFRLFVKYLVLTLIAIPSFALLYGLESEPWRRVSWWNPICYAAFMALFDCLFSMGTTSRLKKADKAIQERAAELGKKLKLKPKHIKLRIIDSANAQAAYVVISFWDAIFLTTGLLSQLAPEELDVVLGHELGHEKTAWALGLILGPRYLGPSLMVLLLEQLAAVYGVERTEIAALPLFLALADVGLFLAKPFENAIRRWLERWADRLALRITGDPEAFVRVITKLYDGNLVDAAPGKVWQLVFGTHPTGLERVKLACR